MHWTERSSSAGPIGRLVSAATDPVSGQPELKATPVRVDAGRAAVARPAAAPPAAQSPSGGLLLVARAARRRAMSSIWPAGRRCRAAEAPNLGARPARRAGAAPELVIYADPARGAFRYASLVEGRLDACLFLSAQRGALPPREALAALLGSDDRPDARTGLLAGTPPRRARPRPGRRSAPVSGSACAPSTTRSHAGN